MGTTPRSTPFSPKRTPRHEPSSSKGPVTYASVPLETVDWSLFDVVCTDLYREARIKDTFPDLLRRWSTFGKPLVITEFGSAPITALRMPVAGAGRS